MGKNLKQVQKISNINVNASVSKEDLVNQVSKEQNLKQNCHSLCWGRPACAQPPRAVNK